MWLFSSLKVLWFVMVKISDSVNQEFILYELLSCRCFFHCTVAAAFCVSWLLQKTVWDWLTLWVSVQSKATYKTCSCQYTHIKAARYWNNVQYIYNNNFKYCDNNIWMIFYVGKDRTMPWTNFHSINQNQRWSDYTWTKPRLNVS